MMKTTALALALLFGLGNGAWAAINTAAPQGWSASVIQVGEGCGADRWRDRNGHCHWFGGPGGSNRGTTIECPPGTHIGEGHGACWPNR